MKKSREKSQFKLKLKGKTVVFIDWANVYGWRKKAQVDIQRLYKYLRKYREVADIRFYFGIDKHKKSKAFLKTARNIGFTTITKEVKYIPISLDRSHFKGIVTEIKKSLKLTKKLKPKDIENILQILNRKILRRKCDFDLEIALDCFDSLSKYDSFIFFSGDGDFATLYKKLIALNKQVIVVYASGHIGREIWEIKRGIFKIKINNLGV